MVQNSKREDTAEALKKIDETIEQLRTMDLTLWGPDDVLNELGSYGLLVLEPLMRATAEGFDLTEKALDAVLAQLDEESGERQEALHELRRIIDAHDATESQRSAAIAAAGKHFAHSESLETSLARIACDNREPAVLRVAALHILGGQRRMIRSVASQICGLLKQYQNMETPLLAAVIGCLKSHAARLSHPTVAGLLDELLESPDQQKRGLAIDLMGEVGELDAIERVCIVPATSQEIPRIQTMIARILQRPRNILSLSPYHFERFTAHLLRKMQYHDVEVTRNSHDGGIDVVAYLKTTGFGEELNEKWIVQCKRYKPGNRVSADDVDALLRVREECGAGKALMITTSSYSSGARARAEGRTDILLTDGEKLLHLLREHYGANRYVIRSEPQ